MAGDGAAGVESGGIDDGEVGGGEIDGIAPVDMQLLSDLHWEIRRGDGPAAEESLARATQVMLTHYDGYETFARLLQIIVEPSEMLSKRHMDSVKRISARWRNGDSMRGSLICRIAREWGVQRLFYYTWHAQSPTFLRALCHASSLVWEDFCLRINWIILKQYTGRDKRPAKNHRILEAPAQRVVQSDLRSVLTPGKRPPLPDFKFPVLDEHGLICTDPEAAVRDDFDPTSAYQDQVPSNDRERGSLAADSDESSSPARDGGSSTDADRAEVLGVEDPAPAIRGASASTSRQTRSKTKLQAEGGGPVAINHQGSDTRKNVGEKKSARPGRGKESVPGTSGNSADPDPKRQKRSDSVHGPGGRRREDEGEDGGRALWQPIELRELPQGSGAKQGLTEEQIRSFATSWNSILEQVPHMLEEVDCALERRLSADEREHLRGMREWVRNMGSPKISYDPDDIEDCDLLVVSGVQFAERCGAEEPLRPRCMVLIRDEAFNDADVEATTPRGFLQLMKDASAHYDSLHVQNPNSAEGRPVAMSIDRMMREVDTPSAYYRQPEKAINALDMVDETNLAQPRAAHDPRFRDLLRVCKTSYGPGKFDKREPNRLPTCCGFAILGFRGAWSPPHVDLCNGTWLRCCSGVKIWPFVPRATSDDFKAWEDADNKKFWCPGPGRAKALVVQKNDVVWMPPGELIIHAPLTLEHSVMVGKQQWDRQRATDQIENMQFIAQRPYITNEDPEDFVDFEAALGTYRDMIRPRAGREKDKL